MGDINREEPINNKRETPKSLPQVGKSPTGLTNKNLNRQTAKKEEERKQGR